MGPMTSHFRYRYRLVLGFCTLRGTPAYGSNDVTFPLSLSFSFRVLYPKMT